MKFADTILNIPNAFKPGPLKAGELEQFYYDKTMYVRTGDAYISPIEDIYEACKMPSGQNTFLLLGHRGCGKSTELNDMSCRLQEEGYQVFTVQCGMDLDLNNPIYVDLLILMGDALLTIADRIGCCLDDMTMDVVGNFWKTEGEQSSIMTDTAGMEVEGEISAKSPGFLASLLQAFVKVKADLKFSEEKRTYYRRQIARRSSEWMFALNKMANQITEEMNGKQPVLIFEDLDKLNPEDAWHVFYQHAATLTGVSFPIIYTFPIALSYDPRFAALEGYFIQKTLPMIKLQNSDGTECHNGYETIIKIISLRASLALFEEDALRLMIEKTGGSLRDLFFIIKACAQRANRRRSDRIECEDAQKALEQLKTSLTRRIAGRHYDFLADIYRGNRERIEDQGMLLEMLQANTVLEYNGKRWHNVHPLVGEFLVEQGMVECDR